MLRPEDNLKLDIQGNDTNSVSYVNVIQLIFVSMLNIKDTISKTK